MKQWFHLIYFCSANLSATSYMVLGKPASLGISFSSIKQLLKDLIWLRNAIFYPTEPLTLGTLFQSIILKWSYCTLRFSLPPFELFILN